MATITISQEQILKILNLKTSARQQKENLEFVKQNKNREKETPIRYSLVDLNFDYDTRITKIVFSRSQGYRTIMSYTTRNYIRHPNYSAWKYKTKNITKTLKLTNLELEKLNKNPDNLIKSFAFEIVYTIGKKELQPSWFNKECITFLANEKIENLKNDLEILKAETENELKKLNQNLTYKSEEIENIENGLNKLKEKEERKENKYKKVCNMKNSVALSFITFGIHAFLTSQTRKNKLLLKIETLKKKIETTTETLNKEISEKNKLIKHIEEVKEKKREKENEINLTIEKEQKQCEENLSYLKPLENKYENDNSFFPLKSITGLEYEKIIGCYVIHNKEKDKYYVGQSKDVLRRLKQHFRGTEPNNVIFAEDYFLSNFGDKSDIFEIKIIRCNTKDELDSTEKKLIEEYDSFNNGYNGTRGNI